MFTARDTTVPSDTGSYTYTTYKVESTEALPVGYAGRIFIRWGSGFGGLAVSQVKGLTALKALKPAPGTSTAALAACAYNVASGSLCARK